MHLYIGVFSSLVSLCERKKDFPWIGIVCGCRLENRTNFGFYASNLWYYITPWGCFLKAISLGARIFTNRPAKFQVPEKSLYKMGFTVYEIPRM